MVAESTAIINNSKKNWSSDHIPKIEITLDPAIKKNSSKTFMISLHLFPNIKQNSPLPLQLV